jgi:hypothetical protein
MEDGESEELKENLDSSQAEGEAVGKNNADQEVRRVNRESTIQKRRNKSMENFQNTIPRR